MSDYQRLATSNSSAEAGLAGPLGAGSPRIARLQMKIASSSRLPNSLKYLFSRALSASTRLTTSTSIAESLATLRTYQFSRGEKFKYGIMFSLAILCMFIMEVPGFPLKLGIPLAYIITLLLPITRQFFLPASPIFSWLLLFYSSKFIPADSRPHIWVSLLPTLETIWYGASISDILTRFGHPALDIFAWIPYGIVHFAGPFFVAAALFIFGPPGSVKTFGSAFGFMNLIGVIIQIGFPCAPPWYELREGQTPANYGMKGSPAGLARIDKLFGGHGYTLTFSNAPVPFGAFPSLHAGSATMEALFLSYFFPLAITFFKPKNGPAKAGGFNGIRFDVRVLYWLYAAWLYWCTMYLMHHYLIDLVAGGCLATICFYFFLTDEMREAMELHYPYRSSSPAPPSAAPSPLRPASAFGVRRTPTHPHACHYPSLPQGLPADAYQGRSTINADIPNITVSRPSVNEQQFGIGAEDEYDEEADPHGGAGGDSMQMTPLLRGTGNGRPSGGSGVNGQPRKLSKRRDVIFSAAYEEDSASDSAADHSDDPHRRSRDQSDGNGSNGMPPLNRTYSASKAA